MADKQPASSRTNIGLAVFFSCLGSTFVFGYCISVANSPRQKIECFFLRTWLSSFTLKNSTLNRTEFLDGCVKAEQLSGMLSSSDDTKLRWMLTMVTVVWVIFAAIGAFLTGIVVDTFGRRNGIIMANFISVLAAISIAPTITTNSPVFIFLSRGLAGLHNGLTIPMQSMYVVEIVPTRLRGALGSMGQLSITIGIFIGGLAGLEQTLNRETYWVVAIALSGVPSLIASLALIFLPESPRYLFMNRGDAKAAKEAVEKFCEPGEVEQTMESLKEEKAQMDKQEALEKFSSAQLFTSRYYRMALILALTIMVGQMLSGINVVMQYSSIMLENSGVEKSTVPFVILGIYALNVLSTVGAIPALEKFGRRTLLLLSLLIVLVSLVALLIVSQFTPKSPSSATNSEKAFAGFACFLIFFYTLGFAIGLGCVPVMYVSEIFQQQARGSANSIACGVQQMTNMLVMLTYYVLEKSMGHFVYLIYIVPVAVVLVFLYFTMPETKNRTVDEIAEELAAVMGAGKGRETATKPEKPEDK